MMRTIITGTCVSVQGEFVEKLADGQITVKVDGVTYTGRPVSKTPK